MTNPITVFVYIRYSSDGQAEGDSIARQRAGATAHVAKLGSDPSNIVWLEDHGFSGWSGRHIKGGALGRFLIDVRAERIRGGIFVCESVSRTSRQGAFALLEIIGTLLKADFTIQYLDGSASFNRHNPPEFLGTHLAMRADLAQLESNAKSEYSQKNWNRRRQLAISEKLPFTAECPRWLRVEGKQYIVIPEMVDAINQLFQLARNGWGISKLVGYANINKLPVPGKPTKKSPIPTYHSSLVNRLLHNRALVGEFQPHVNLDGKRVPLGDPIKDYYPLVIDKDLFNAVSASRDRAPNFPKRRDDNNFNFLMGIATCGCGSSWRRMNKNSGAQQGYAQYGCSSRTRSVCPSEYLNARSFDYQFISFACETIPAMLNSGKDPTADKRISLESQIATVEKNQAAQIAFIESNPDLVALTGERIRALVIERESLKCELDALNGLSVPPPGFEFGDAVGVFLPAFLDVYPAGTPEFDDAFRARALFRSRVLDSIRSVSIPVDRLSFTVTLKNGVALMQELERLKFGAVRKELDAEELAELELNRSTSLKVIRRIHNSPISD